MPRCHNSTNCSETSLQEEVSNANYIHNEETTTNEESIKDVQDAQSSLMKAIQILRDFYAKAGEGNDLIRQKQFSETHYTLTRNASRRTVNVEPDLQRKSDDRYQCHQLSPGDSERLREARVEDHRGRVTSSLGKPWKVLGTVWRPTPTILFVVRTQPESSVNTLSVIQDIDQRIRPTMVQAGAYVSLEDYEDTLHQVDGKNQQLFTCPGSEYAGNRIRVLYSTQILTVLRMSDEEG